MAKKGVQRKSDPMSREEAEEIFRVRPLSSQPGNKKLFILSVFLIADHEISTSFFGTKEAKIKRLIAHRLSRYTCTIRSVICNRTKTTITKGFDQKLHNVLKRDFDPVCPDSVWCTDITYVWTEEGFVYLTSITDLFSRKIIAWALSKNLSTDEVVRCVEMAKWRRKIKDPLVLHSDRGVQYTSQVYQGQTRGMTLSYSRKGNPWDNACIESFHSLIKREWLQFYRLKNYEEARAAIFEYIEGFYNTNRVHSWCGYMSPNEYEKAYRQSEKEMN